MWGLWDGPPCPTVQAVIELRPQHQAAPHAFQTDDGTGPGLGQHVPPPRAEGDQLSRVCSERAVKIGRHVVPLTTFFLEVFAASVQV